MKIKFTLSLIVVTLLLAHHAIAQRKNDQSVIDVSHQWEVTNIHGPSQVGISDSIAVDLNSDGWMDVVSVSIDDGSIRAYINPANLALKSDYSVDLNYTQQIIEENEIGLYRIISTDINADGRPDLIATSIESQKVFGYTQQPDGNFQKAVIAENILLPTDVVAGDFNGDGLMDLASISFENNQVYQHLQQVSGTFTTEIIAENVMRPRKLTSSDWNQDGYIDVAVASEEDNSVRILFNKSYLGWSERLVTDLAIGTRNLTHCDLDQNGLQDLVVSHSGENALVAYYNYGVWPYQPTVIDSAAMGVNAVLCHDLNSDGQMDLAAIYALHGNIYSYFQNEGFIPNLVANTRDGYITLAAADFNQTQQPQILTQGHFEQRNFFYDQEALNSESVVWEDFPDGAYHVASGDFNGDGLEDVVYAAFREDKVYWAEQTSSGYDIHLLFDGVEGPQSVTVGDIDQDGDLDVITAGAWDDTFWLHTNNGQGAFLTSTLLTEANNAARSKIVDLNGDGVNDVVVTSSLDDSVRWIDLSTTKPTVHLISNQMDGALSFDVLDYDNDDDLDIAVGNFFGNEVVLLRNLENNKFVSETIEDDFTKPNAVIFCDIDNNSNAEVIFGSSTETVLKVVYLEQANMINSGVLFTDLHGLSDVECADVENNGWNDLFTSSINEELIRFHFNYFLKFKAKIISNTGQYRSLSVKVKENSLTFKVVSITENVIREGILIDKIFSDGFQ